ncbi:Protein SHORT-ROOT [Acorus calamus]|uniref:Protein SHORT-ROOT n=1 Tax=Acorus calamus TaxID=4465 RepID=A0AAV9D1C0_ACOCL|nr:Protein SHORT-ROOT [Acorus calamus]
MKKKPSPASSSHSSDPANPDEPDEWAPKLLRECAKAIDGDGDSNKAHHLLWMLNELSSPFGDRQQKLASHFLHALFAKATGSGAIRYRALTSVAEKALSFKSRCKTILKFQELSPWTTFGHVASNGAILEVLENEPNLHIIDFSDTLCTQWPTLLEALATRSGDETPRLRLSVVSVTRVRALVMGPVAQRMERFARLMGVPFEFRALGEGFARLEDLREMDFDVRDDEAVAVNLVGALRRVGVERRDGFIGMLARLKPKVVTVVEEEADFTSNKGDFLECFEECLRFHNLVFETYEESFQVTSNERLVLERECSRGILRVLACDDSTSEGECERRERGSQWCWRLGQAFELTGFSGDVVDDVKALLKRYRSGWSLSSAPAGDGSAGLYLVWKEEPVVWASAWKPLIYVKKR